MNGTATTNFYLNMIDITDYSSVNMKNYSLPKKNYKAYFELIAKNNSQTNETNGDINFYYRNIAASSTGKQAVTYAQFIRIIQGNVGVTVKDFQITDDTIVSYMYITAGVVLDNLKFRFAILDENETNTDYEEHKQENYILQIQQEMLNGDYFEKEKDGWKEVHGWNKLTFIGNENFNKSGSATDEVFVATLDIDDGIEGKGYSNYFKHSSEIAIGNFLVYNNGSNIRFCVDGTEIATIEQFKVLLQQKNSEGNPLCAFYKLATPTKLACTEEQSTVLDKLNNLDLFKNTNNIITTEDIALLKLKYVADTKTYVDKEISDIKEQINTINELLSTTGTSSLLLDNLQSDLESEVM